MFTSLGFSNKLSEIAGTYNKYGQPNYHLKINHNNTLINLTEGDNYFDPTGFAGVSQITGKSANRKQLINTLASIVVFPIIGKAFDSLIPNLSFCSASDNVFIK